MSQLSTDVQRYLAQQQQMHGSTVYVEPGVDVDTISLMEPPAPPAVIVHEPVSPTMGEDMANWKKADTMTELNAAISSCLQCPLGATRTNFVFGSGNENADLMIVGEAPGADEDEQGLPFVGRAGQLLTKILEAINFTRDEVYICNILKCRPPNNRKPLAAETDECEPYLLKQIELVRPRYILALGLTAANTLLKNKESMSALRGRIHNYHGIHMMVTYHPAALLRNPEWKKYAWEDVQHLRKLYDGV
jgi:uracil-DNA glycosylase family 4